MRDEGFHPDLFGTLVGASGGPKWLVLRALDGFWSERLLAGRSRPLDVVGSSIGSFRHACLAQSDPAAAFARFCDAYVEQSYDEDRMPAPDTVTRESLRILEEMLGEKGAEEIVTNPGIRSHIVVARMRHAPGVDRGLLFKLRLAASAIANAASREALALFYERGVFSSSGDAIRFDDLPTHYHALAPGDVSAALLASGSIPSVLAGVPRIGSEPGMFFDGGIIDYHFDFKFERPPGLVLFPHFFDRITPGWFDKPLRWRRPAAADVDDVVMVAPSDEFVASLPGAKVPDRNDFTKMKNVDRIRRWREVLERCEALVDDWNDLVDGGGLAEAIRPFES